MSKEVYIRQCFAFGSCNCQIITFSSKYNTENWYKFLFSFLSSIFHDFFWQILGASYKSYISLKIVCLFCCDSRDLKRTVYWFIKFQISEQNKRAVLKLRQLYKDRSTNLFSNVYVVFYLGLLAEIDNAAQEVEQTFKRFELLKQINQWACCQLLVVFGGNLNHNLEKRIFD